ncbi:hypothetical protein GOP47_0003983 [Adiantum capillus-veneris]|uniref:Tropinone reductase n=1 Tax=Adiantum capillus-veneris TaxID=13818 RepID=A0A9D4ZPY2_ADICA|nr:hypothetical protein GOP47_0003983 [Adiantum capillus-veneris]
MEAFSARWSLKGRTALVTCGSRGIGKAIVEELAYFGASVFTCSRVSSHLEECLFEWQQAALQVAGTVCDAGSRQGRLHLIRDVSHHFGGKLDIFVNNVGVIEVKPAIDVTEDDFASTISLNLEAEYHFSQLVHPLLKAAGNGRIVFVSSILGMMTPAFPCSVYAMCKGATNQLTRVLAAEWVKDSILVNAVAPGVIDTESQVAESHSKTTRDIPMERAGSPREAAAAVAFFCLPCSSFCTGQIFIVDGGTTVRPAFAPSKATTVSVPSKGRSASLG